MKDYVGNYGSSQRPFQITINTRHSFQFSGTQPIGCSLAWSDRMIPKSDITFPKTLFSPKNRVLWNEWNITLFSLQQPRCEYDKTIRFQKSYIKLPDLVRLMFAYHLSSYTHGSLESIIFRAKKFFLGRCWSASTTCRSRCWVWNTTEQSESVSRSEKWELISEHHYMPILFKRL